MSGRRPRGLAGASRGSARRFVGALAGAIVLSQAVGVPSAVAVGGTIQIAASAQRITVDQALRAVTIEAAYSWRQEDRIGSIKPGKIANFTVLEQDPHAVAPIQLKDVPIWGTVFEGRIFPVPASARQIAGRGAVAAPLYAQTGHASAGDRDEPCDLAALSQLAVVAFTENVEHPN